MLMLFAALSAASAFAFAAVCLRRRDLSLARLQFSHDLFAGVVTLAVVNFCLVVFLGVGTAEYCAAGISPLSLAALCIASPSAAA